MKLFQSLKELRMISKTLFLGIIALFIFFVSEVLRRESYSLDSIIRGNFSLSELPELLNYSNFIPVISFILLYLVVKNLGKIANEEKEKYLISLTIIVFVFHYVFQFFIIERLLSLYKFSVNSLPNSITDFLPFDWSNFRGDYAEFQIFYEIGEYQLHLIFSMVFSVISLISFLASVFFSLKFLHSRKIKLEIKRGLIYIKSFFKSIKTSVAVLSIVMVFSIFGIQNIKASDYSTISIETMVVQDDLKVFQEELTLANQKIIESEKLDGRKAAANKAYSSIATKEERLKIDLSLWSNDLEELNSEVVEWIVLWKKLLREGSIQGYVDPGTLFDLNQKYSEVAKLGKSAAPQLASDVWIDFWDEEFYSLISQ
jgi:hypothetical protein